MSDNYYFEEDVLSPLLSLEAAKFRIKFRAEKRWRIFGAEAALRGRLGFHLKRKCCPFPGFRKKPCDDCALSGNCLYLTLFSPGLAAIRIFPDGRTIPARTPVRPFLIALNGGGERGVLEPGETGSAEFTLFGEGIRHCTLFLETAVTAIASFSLHAEELKLISPSGADSPDHQAELNLAWPLSEWVRSAGDEHGCEDVLKLRFVTPVRLVSAGKIVRDEFTFSLLIRSLVRRLRDFRKAFTDERDMGKTDRAFYEAADAVTVCENRLRWSRRKRYSFRQKQDVALNGFRGNICFSGPFRPFLPLVKAGEMIHIGKGTSNGNGRFCCICTDCE